MSWVDMISSALGVSAGGVAVSGAIYAGAVALENEMRSEAKQQIATVIKRENRLPTAEIVIGFVHESFRWLFGAKHLSWRCLRRSFLASIVFWIFFTALFVLKYQDYVLGGVSSEIDSVDGVIGFFLVTPLISLLPDYLSLWKGRLLLERSVRDPRLYAILLLVVIDLFLSFLISYCAFALVGAATYPFTGQPAELAPYEAWAALIDGFKILLGYPPADQSDILVVTFTLTTLMTSLWVMLVLLAALGTKLLTGFTYFARAINWIFDVDAHPVRVLGLVASIIVWTGSLMYGLV